jgi:2-methylcitrate dehydratase PrpD
LLTTLVIGYEVALRAGLALHATACDYHTSGAWNALGCAAVVARRQGLGADHTRQALGIAEFHGPRSQMMRCIDHPTMLKDGSGWGAMAGVSAALLARGGFTGAPALTVEAPEVGPLWADLGHTWLITAQYFKPYAVCRWAQPAVVGALALRDAHALDPQSIARIRVHTFHEATRLASPRPTTAEEAQYNLPFPVATALVQGEAGLAELSGATLDQAAILRLAQCVELVDDPAFNRRFTAERWARVQIETTAGAVLDSGEVQARWDTIAPTDDELRDKFHSLACAGLSEGRAGALAELVWHCADLDDATRLLTLLIPPGDKMGPAQAALVT